jgi:hypothetical protein
MITLEQYVASVCHLVRWKIRKQFMKAGSREDLFADMLFAAGSVSRQRRSHQINMPRTNLPFSLSFIFSSFR